jgi:hypothetical protein
VLFLDVLLSIRAHDETRGLFYAILAPCLLTIFLPALTYGAYRAMHGAKLVVAEASAPLPSRANRAVALELVLLPLLAISFFALWGFWLPVLKSIPLGETPALRDATLLCIRSAGPALLGLAFAYPIAKVFGRRALVAGFMVTLPTVASRTWNYLDQAGGSFLVTTRTIEMASLAVVLPLAAWMLARRFADSRLAILPYQPPAELSAGSSVEISRA